MRATVVLLREQGRAGRDADGAATIWHLFLLNLFANLKLTCPYSQTRDLDDTNACRYSDGKAIPVWPHSEREAAQGIVVLKLARRRHPGASRWRAEVCWKNVNQLRR
jgi:hypothetical protein